MDSESIRYAQCWEDADVLLEGLAVAPGDVCLAIASAGDNALALLTRDPDRVIAVDISSTQLACLELRVAAFRTLEHAGLLELIGAAPSERRAGLYRLCRGLLSDEARDFWDGHPQLIAEGIGRRGVFEDYFRLFRRWVLPLINGPERLSELFSAGSWEAGRGLNALRCDNWRWRLAIRVLFSQTIMRHGHGPWLFYHATGPVWPHVQARLERALRDLADNPYLQWLLLERYATALPAYLRPENFPIIRGALDRLEWHRISMQEALRRFRPLGLKRFHLSNILEYMPPESCRTLLERVAASGLPGGRLLYWDMVSPRTEPGAVAGLRRLEELGVRLFAQNKFCFFNALVIEEIHGQAT